MSVLDVGCGPGGLTRELVARVGADNVAAIDPSPPFVEVNPKSARPGDTIQVFVNPLGLEIPGQYPIYINVKAKIDGRPISQSVEGYIVADQTGEAC